MTQYNATITIKFNVQKNKYQANVLTQRQSQYLDYLIYSSFQGANRLFVLSFEDNAVRTWNIEYCLPILEMMDQKVLNNGQNFFDQLVKNDIRIYENIQKVIMGQGDDYTTSCSLDYPYFKETTRSLQHTQENKEAFYFKGNLQGF